MGSNMVDLAIVCASATVPGGNLGGKLRTPMRAIYQGIPSRGDDRHESFRL